MARLLRDEGPVGGSLAAVVLAAAWVATWRPQLDPDAWWHIAIGESIAETGAIPATEPFSWLTVGGPFVAHSWLWDVLLAGAWRAAGATGTSLLVLPVTALVVWLLWQLARVAAPTIPPLGRAGLVLAAVVVTLPTWAPRAQTLDVAFVLATVLVLARYLHSGSTRGLVALPLVGLLWANLHGSAILALPASVAIALVALPVGVRWEAWPRRAVGPLLLAGLAGVIATVVNPYGARLLVYPFDRSVASAFSPAIVEWGSPDFGSGELVAFRLLLAGLLLGAVWLPARARDPFLLLSATGWTFAALGSVRFLAIGGPLLVVALAPAIGPAVARWFGMRSTADVATEPAELAAAGVTAVRRGPTIAIAAVAIACILAAGWLIIDPARQAAAIERRLPVAAVLALEGSGCSARLLPAYGWAGYVLWATGRQVGAYGNSAEGPVSEQARVEAVVVDPRPWLDQHGVGAVMMPAEGPLSHWLDEAAEWRVSYSDPQATIHVRLDAADCAIGTVPTTLRSPRVRPSRPG
jgi:hypothetical protein